MAEQGTAAKAWKGWFCQWSNLGISGEKTNQYGPEEFPNWKTFHATNLHKRMTTVVLTTDNTVVNKVYKLFETSMSQVCQGSEI